MNLLPGSFCSVSRNDENGDMSPYITHTHTQDVFHFQKPVLFRLFQNKSCIAHILSAAPQVCGVLWFSRPDHTHPQLGEPVKTTVTSAKSSLLPL